MVKGNLDKLKVADFDDAWDGELDFTRWLSSDEGIELLSLTLDIGLEAVAREHSIGSLRADLICRDTTEGALAVVENQVGRSDHSHLGKVLAYAAGAGAANIVWIAESFRDEHRAVVDWLNESTADRIRLFALEIEVWKIGNSNPAPKFNVVCQPNDWRKIFKIEADAPSSTASKTNRTAFWTRVLGKMKPDDRIGRPVPRDSAWISFKSKLSGAIRLPASFAEKRGKLRVHLESVGEYSRAYVGLLEEQREEIEAEIGETLDFALKPKGRASTISLERFDVDFADQSKWDDYAQWLVDNLNRFYDAFWGRVDQLDPSEWIDPDEIDVDDTSDDGEIPKDD